MAKALFGHVGGAADQQLRDEVQRLRKKIQALEFEVTRLRADNDRLTANLVSHEHDLRRVGALEEPALT